MSKAGRKKTYYNDAEGKRRVRLEDVEKGVVLFDMPLGEPELPTEASEMPRWAKMALATRVLEGLTLEQTAKRFKKSFSSVSKYSSSPAGRKWQADIKAHADDPEAVASTLLRGSIIGVTQGYIWAYEQGKAAGDYNFVAQSSRDILDRFGVRKNTPLSEKNGKIIINLGGVSLEAPKVSVDFKEILPSEIVDDEDSDE